MEKRKEKNFLIEGTMLDLYRRIERMEEWFLIKTRIGVTKVFGYLNLLSAGLSKLVHIYVRQCGMHEWCGKTGIFYSKGTACVKGQMCEKA